jgi:hypothetical protein
LNDVIDRYNETRQGQAGAATLSKEMGHFGLQSGYEFAFGRVIDDAGWFADFHLGILEAGTHAEGVSLDGTTARRDLRLVTHSLGIGVGASIIQNNHMEVGVGGSFHFSRNRVYTSVNEEPEELAFEDPVPISLTPFLQATLFLSRKIPLAVFGRGYFELPVLATDYAEVNEKINPATYVNDEDRDFSSRNWRPGFTAGVALILHERDRSFHQ